jgi:hypothetical protein
MSSLPIYEKLLDILKTPEEEIEPRKELAYLFAGSVPFEITDARRCLTETVVPASALTGLFAQLPTCLPVYAKMYFEYEALYGDRPGSLYSEGRYALLCGTIRREKRLTAQDPMWSVGSSVIYEGLMTGEDDGELFEERGIGTGFIVPTGGALSVFELVFRNQDGDIGTITGLRIIAGFDENGNILRHEDTLALQVSDDTKLDQSDEDEAQTAVAKASLCESVYTALFACSILHCKNVSERLNYLPRQLARARERRQLPPIVWKTIEVSPLRAARTATTELDNSDDEKHKKRLHLCRGHFAEYGINGKGKLFGKYSGRFWIPPVVKGSATVGVVVQDYKVRG